jgi:hypothetical protein
MRVTSIVILRPLSCTAVAVALVAPIKPLLPNLEQGPRPDKGATLTFEILRKEFV